MLIETSGSNSDHDEEKVNNFLTRCMESGNVLDGTVTNEPTKIKVIYLKVHSLRIDNNVVPKLRNSGMFEKGFLLLFSRMATASNTIYLCHFAISTVS